MAQEDVAQDAKPRDTYTFPGWLVRWAVPVIILGGVGWLTQQTHTNAETSRRITILETKGQSIEQRLERIEHQNDDIKLMLQTIVEKDRPKWKPKVD